MLRPIFVYLSMVILLFQGKTNSILHAIEDGNDVALNDLQCLLDMFHPADPISMGKYFVNLVAKRPDLWNNSLTAVPHAMHKRVIEKIGYDSLIIPPLAQMKAILEGFSITAVDFVDVIKQIEYAQSNMDL